MIAAVGAVIGLGIGTVATRVLASVLFNVSTSDPATMAGSIAMLFVAILLACYAPARRAASVDPARTLVEQ